MNQQGLHYMQCSAGFLALPYILARDLILPATTTPTTTCCRRCGHLYRIYTDACSGFVYIYVWIHVCALLKSAAIRLSNTHASNTVVRRVYEVSEVVASSCGLWFVDDSVVASASRLDNSCYASYQSWRAQSCGNRIPLPPQFH
jgi:hypothetical protein